jgi:hypothetical protein
MLYSGGLRAYRTILAECAAQGYRGFEFSAAASSSLKTPGRT